MNIYAITPAESVNKDRIAMGANTESSFGKFLVPKNITQETRIIYTAAEIAFKIGFLVIRKFYYL